MIGEILGKALIVVKGDTKHARDEIAKLSAAEQMAAKARVKAQEESNAALERGNQKFGLYVAGAAAGWAVISSSVKKYEEHLKSLGESGEEELSKLQNVTGTLSKAQDNLQIAIAKVALEAAPAAIELAKMANELARIVGGIADIVNAAKNFRVGGYRVGDIVSDVTDTVTENLPGPVGDYFRRNKMVRRLGGGLDPRTTAAMTGMPSQDETPGARYGDGAYETRSPEWYRAMGWRLQSNGVWLPPLPQEERRRGGRTRQVEEGPSYGFLGGIWGEGAAYAGNIASEVGTAWDANAGAGTSRSFGGDAYARIKGEQRELSEGLDKLMEELASEQRESMLTRIFGPVEQFDAYAAGFDLLRTASTAAFQAWIDGSMGAGKAAKEAAAGVLTAKATELLGIGMASVGRGIVDLATGNPKGAGEIAAGGKAIAQAALIGGLAKALHAGSAGSTATANAAAGIGRTAGVVGEGDGRVMNVYMGDWTSSQDARTNAIKFREVQRRARTYAPPPAGVGD